MPWTLNSAIAGTPAKLNSHVNDLMTPAMAACLGELSQVIRDTNWIPLESIPDPETLPSRPINPETGDPEPFDPTPYLGTDREKVGILAVNVATQIADSGNPITAQELNFLQLFTLVFSPNGQNNWGITPLGFQWMQANGTFT